MASRTAVVGCEMASRRVVADDEMASKWGGSLDHKMTSIALQMLKLLGCKTMPKEDHGNRKPPLLIWMPNSLK